MAKNVKKEKTPEQVVGLLVRCLEADNGVRYSVTAQHSKQLVSAITEMQRAGWEASSADIRLIAMGDQDKAGKKFGSVPGFRKLNKALGIVFEEDVQRPNALKAGRK